MEVAEADAVEAHSRDAITGPCWSVHAERAAEVHEPDQRSTVERGEDLDGQVWLQLGVSTSRVVPDRIRGGFLELRRGAATGQRRVGE